MKLCIESKSACNVRTSDAPGCNNPQNAIPLHMQPTASRSKKSSMYRNAGEREIERCMCVYAYMYIDICIRAHIRGMYA